MINFKLLEDGPYKGSIQVYDDTGHLMASIHPFTERGISIHRHVPVAFSGFQDPRATHDLRTPILIQFSEITP